MSGDLPFLSHAGRPMTARLVFHGDLVRACPDLTSPRLEPFIEFYDRGLPGYEHSRGRYTGQPFYLTALIYQELNRAPSNKDPFWVRTQGVPLSLSPADLTNVLSWAVSALHQALAQASIEHLAGPAEAPVPALQTITQMREAFSTTRLLLDQVATNPADVDPRFMAKAKERMRAVEESLEFSHALRVFSALSAAPIQATGGPLPIAPPMSVGLGG